MSIVHRNMVVIAASLLLLSLAATRPAHGQTVSSADDKSMSGGACVPGLQTAYTDFDIRASYIQNKATGYRWVACSMTSDSESDWQYADYSGSPGYADAQVYVRYGSTSGSTQCTWQVIDTLGNVIETKSASVNGVAGTNYSLQSGAMTLGGGDGHAWGVNCLIPPGARIHYINWEEFAETNPQTIYP